MATRNIGPSPAGRRAGLGEYFKRAFLYRWNLLAFAGGVAASILSPWPDALLPLLAAAELLYLTLLVSQERFRQAVDATVSRQASERRSAPVAQKPVQDIVAGLSFDARRRFEQLRMRCLEMRAIAQGVRGRGAAPPPAGEDLNSSALDRLLWVFLRLLTSQEALNRFLQRTNPDDIRARLAEARQRLEAQKDADERMLRSLRDSVAVQEMRLENYQKAENNAEFLRIELDRIEAKIQALTEAAVNHQDPDFLSSQIDSVAASMQSTENAIQELRHITGMIDEMQEPPAILESDFGKVTQG